MKLSIYALALGLGLSSPFAQAQTQTPAQSTGQSPELLDRWASYVADAQKRPLQEGCKPRRFAADSKVPFRGTVLLHHGFTACAQQFFELAEKHLNPLGYDVLVTVLPGHGGVWDEKGHDDYQSLMGRADWESTTDTFTSRMNEIMQAAAGERVIGGLSVGGEFALDAVHRAPGLYSKLILLSPFFRLSTAKKEFEPGTHRFLRLVQEIAGPLNRRRPELIDQLADPRPPLGLRPFKGFKNRRTGWGKGCSETERGGGRAGTCEFSLDRISAIQKYGAALLERPLPAQLQVQIVGVQADPTAATERMRVLADRFGKESGAPASFCLLPRTANHSLLSRYDSPAENKYWIDPLLKKAAAFISKSETLAISAESAGDAPFCAEIVDPQGRP